MFAAFEILYPVLSSALPLSGRAVTPKQTHRRYTKVIQWAFGLSKGLHLKPGSEFPCYWLYSWWVWAMQEGSPLPLLPFQQPARTLLILVALQWHQAVWAI